MAKWEDFFPRVLSEVQGCPVPLVTEALRDAAAEFCQKTWVWKEVVPFQTDKDYREGYVTVPRGSRLVSVISLSDDGTDKDIPDGMHIRSERSNLWFTKKQEETLDIEALAVLKPSETSTSCSDFLYNEYAEAIAWGAKARLLYDIRKPWGQPELAVLNHQLFHKAIAQTKIYLAKSYTKKSLRVKPRKFI